MSRFRKLSQTIWHCQYHIIWVRKYRYRILTGKLAKETEYMIRTYSAQLKAEVIELNVQVDHVHLLAMIPPKFSISKFMGVIKGKTAIRILNKYKDLRVKPYWGNHFWARGYCVDTVGLDTEMVRTYVKFQETNEKKAESRNH